MTEAEWTPNGIQKESERIPSASRARARSARSTYTYTYTSTENVTSAIHGQLVGAEPTAASPRHTPAMDAADALFEVDESEQRTPVEPLSADQRRTQRQRADIANGRHPLPFAPHGMALHPDASRDPDDHETGPRCGTCIARLAGSYPKCLVVVNGQRPNVSRGPATDCRAWWPACKLYEPEER